MKNKKQKPVVVPDNADADKCNKKYGERYGMDWVYAGKKSK